MTFIKLFFSTLIALILAGCTAKDVARHIFLTPEEIRIIDGIDADIEEAVKRSEPFLITNLKTEEPNSASGVDVRMRYVNLSERPFKYFIITAAPYNGVGDMVYSTIGNESLERLNHTGPSNPFSTKRYGGRWETVWYNWSIKCTKIVSIETVFMDDTRKIYSDESRISQLMSGRAKEQCARAYVTYADE